MKNNREVRSKMAAMLERVTLKSHNTNMRLWKGEPDMEEMFIGDLADHKKLAGIIRKNDLHRAYRFMVNMDTAPREDIPDTVWNWINKVTE